MDPMPSRRARATLLGKEEGDHEACAETLGAALLAFGPMARTERLMSATLACCRPRSAFDLG